MPMGGGMPAPSMGCGMPMMIPMPMMSQQQFQQTTPSKRRRKQDPDEEGDPDDPEDDEDDSSDSSSADENAKKRSKREWSSYTFVGGPHHGAGARCVSRQQDVATLCKAKKDGCKKSFKLG